MSFKDLELASKAGNVEWISRVISDLDRSWDVTTKITMSVFAMLVAVTPYDHRYLAKEVINGMIGVFRDLFDHDNNFDLLMQESIRIDSVGQNLFEHLDPFGRAVLDELLANLPFKWKDHIIKFDQFVNVGGQFTQFNSSTSQLFYEQSRITNILFNMCSNLCSDDLVTSREVKLSTDWFESVREYVSLLPLDLSASDLLVNVINRFGFPDVCIL